MKKHIFYCLACNASKDIFEYSYFILSLNTTYIRKEFFVNEMCQWNVLSSMIHQISILLTVAFVKESPSPDPQSHCNAFILHVFNNVFLSHPYFPFTCASISFYLLSFSKNVQKDLSQMLEQSFVSNLHAFK